MKILWLLAWLPAALQAQQVQLVGQFRDSAVLLIDGSQRLLKAGETSPEGVRLVTVESGVATLVLANGERQQVQLSRAPGSYQEVQRAWVAIAADAAGHYMTGGSINGRPVQFLVDTGATSIAMNTRDARRLGIDFTAGEPAVVATAGGRMQAYKVRLDRVKVGDIEFGQIEAVVLEGIYPEIILLGMTYLSQVRMVEEDGMLRLIQKY